LSDPWDRNGSDTDGQGLLLDTPPSPRHHVVSWVTAAALAALFILAVVTINIQSQVTALRYRVAHLAQRQGQWREHVAAAELAIASLKTPPRLRQMLGPRHDLIAVSLVRKDDQRPADSLE